MPNLPTFSREEPYHTFDKQRFAHEGNTSLGVNGTLYVIPESEAFRIEGFVTDVEKNIVANATINVYMKTISASFLLKFKCNYVVLIIS